MFPVLFQTDLFGLLSEPLKLHTYGVLIGTGFLVAMSLVTRQAEREGENPDQYMDLGFYLLLSGLIGARLVFILTKWDEYLSSPLDIVMFWRGGLVWYGGFIGAAVFVWYYGRKHKLNYFKIVDILIPYMALAHAFGRLGCLAAGCCYGKVTELPWGIVFPSGSMPHHGQVADGTVGIDHAALPIHPTQLYEAGGELVLFALLLWMRPYKRFHGQLFLIWLSVYPVMRSAIELVRGDKERGIYVLSTSQFISIGVAATALWLFFHLTRKQAAFRASSGASSQATA